MGIRIFLSFISMLGLFVTNNPQSINQSNNRNNVIIGDNSSPTINFGDQVNGSKIVNNFGSEQLNQISSLEDGKTISKIHDKTYFFASPSDIEHSYKEPDSITTKRSGTGLDFQIHKKEDGTILVIGYTDSESFSKINTVDKNNPLSLPLLSGSMATYTDILGIPLESVLKLKMINPDKILPSSKGRFEITTTKVERNIQYRTRTY